jgi:two-component system response regulator
MMQRSQPNILLVMDDDMDEGQIVHVLTKYHFSNSITRLKRVREAIKYFGESNSDGENRNQRKPELVVLSLSESVLQPVIPNIESLKKEMKDIPLICVSGSREQEDAIRALNLPRTHCMGKPLGFFKLLEAMQKLGMYWLVLNSSPDG